VNNILETYLARTLGSAAKYRPAQRVMPGGNSRRTSYWPPYPLLIERATGPHMFDVDGNSYVDLTNIFTSLVHRHGYPPVVEAIGRQRGYREEEQRAGDGISIHPQVCRSVVELSRESGVDVHAIT
jgi:4-aminobutyrate aminotransferase-like enzyme